MSIALHAKIKELEKRLAEVEAQIAAELDKRLADVQPIEVQIVEKRGPGRPRKAPQ